MNRAALLVCSCFSVVVAVSAQSVAQKPPQPTFRTGVDLVLLDVSVLDENRVPVRGLTAADFTVLQDGRPQPITSFAAIDLPDRPAPGAVGWMQEVRADVETNQGVSDRRIVAILLDDATPMPAEEVPRMKTLARRVIERLGTDDLGAVIFPFNTKAGQSFTTDHARLLAAVDRFNGSADRMPVLGAYDPLQATANEVYYDQYNPKALALYSSVVGTVKGLADYLIDLPERRKVLVFGSIGLPLDVGAAQTPPIDLKNPMGDTAGGALMLFKDLQAALEAAQRANINVYGLEPGGLRAPLGSYDAMAGTGRLDGAPGNLNRDFLHALSANTGGFPLEEQNGFEAAITQMLRENGSYYLIGYPRPTPHVDGRFHRVEVRVKRPGATVRARNGFFEPAAASTSKASASGTAQALASVLPKADVALQLAAAPLAVAGKREAAVAIAVGVRQATPARDAAHLADDVDMQVNAYDPEGKLRASRRLTGRVTLRADSQAAAEYDMITRLDLAPGRYQLRVALHSSLQGKSGSVFYDLDVPDFAALPLALSGVVVTANPGSVAAPKDALAGLLPVAPTSSRAFGKDQQVTALMRVYQRAGRAGGAGGAGGDEALAPVPMSVMIFDATGAMVFDASPTLAVERFARDRAADCAFDLPIANLQPGPHLLRIEARLGDTTARRDVRFEVR